MCGVVQLYQLSIISICLVYTALNQRNVYYLTVVKVYSKFWLRTLLNVRKILSGNMEKQYNSVKSLEFGTSLSWFEFHLCIPLTCITMGKLPNLSVPKLHFF